jgi:sulfoxide reductase heme-binding subunit YedZ
LGRRRLVAAALFAAASLPLGLLAWRAARGELGANPIETVEHATGLAALRLLLATLAVTPLRRLAGWHFLAPHRRLLGLFAFFYASLHFLAWSALDLGLEWAAMLEDVAERPYVTAGFAAFLLLLPLAVTSTRGWVRRLGRRWVTLHRLVYASAALAVLHFTWLVKKDLREPLLYAGLLGLLLAARLRRARVRRAGAPVRVSGPSRSP